MPALLSVAAGPWSHVTSTAWTACIACQGLSATAATAPLPPRWPGTASTRLTPGSASAAVPSTVATLPPSVGHITTLAYSMPGSTVSVPKRALPSCLPAASRRGMGLPISVHWAAVLRRGLSGSGCLAAASTNSPNRALRPEPAWITTPLLARHSATGTAQPCAAAATSMARALAPACRIGSQLSLMLDEPPVTIRPISRMVLAVIQAAPRRSVLWSSGWKGRPSTTVDRLL